MKKFLLLAAATTMAASAMAQVFTPASEIEGEDLSPVGFRFNTYNKEFVGYTTANVLNWNMTVNWFRDNVVAEDKTVEDGLVVVSGPYYNNQAEHVAELAQGTKIIDLGGTTGKVLALNFTGSEFPAKYKEITGTDLEIGEIPSSFPLLFWHFDHTKYQNCLGQVKDGEDYMPLRVRIEMNIFANNQSTTGELWKAYVNDDQNNVRPAGKDDNTAPDICVEPAEFAYRWCEKSDDPQDAEDDSVWDEESETGVWNPNRWLVYEWDINAAAPESEDDPFQYAIRLKNEIPGAQAGNMTVLIRNISLYIPEDENREYVYQKRLRTWNNYSVGTPTGLNTVVAEGAEFSYNVNGGVVSFSAPAKVYSLSGSKVAEGSVVTLNKGIYVAQSGAKAVKLVVK